MTNLLKFIGEGAAALILITLGVTWWTGRQPQRPRGVAANAIYLERSVVPFKTSTEGNWLECWFDDRELVNRCKLTDKTGDVKYDGVFVPYQDRSAVPQDELIFDSHRTGTLWTGSYEKHIHVPIIYLANGTILLPRDAYEDARQAVRKSEAAVK
jgi:hypothetical protein